MPEGRKIQIKCFYEIFSHTVHIIHNQSKLTTEKSEKLQYFIQ